MDGAGPVYPPGPAAQAVGRVALVALPGLPEVMPGHDLAALVAAAADRCGEGLHDGDVVVLAQKVVSKAEDRFVRLDRVVPGSRALELAERTGKDPRLVAVILAEAPDVVRAVPGLLIVRHRLGFVLANAGVDASNVRDGYVLLLPADPDLSARRIADGLRRISGARVGVVINDSWGRAWRRGTVGTAIGVDGMPAIWDRRGEPDRFGRTLLATEIGIADEIASAASLLMGAAAEGQPAVLVRGWRAPAAVGRAADLVRPVEQDLFL